MLKELSAIRSKKLGTVWKKVRRSWLCSIAWYHSVFSRSPYPLPRPRSILIRRCYVHFRLGMDTSNVKSCFGLFRHQPHGPYDSSVTFRGPSTGTIDGHYRYSAFLASHSSRSRLRHIHGGYHDRIVDIPNSVQVFWTGIVYAVSIKSFISSCQSWTSLSCRYVLLVASISFLPPVLCPTNLPVVFAGFIIFETCVGIFWPSMGYMRGIYVPEGGKIKFCPSVPLWHYFCSSPINSDEFLSSASEYDCNYDIIERSAHEMDLSILRTLLGYGLRYSAYSEQVSAWEWFFGLDLLASLNLGARLAGLRLIALGTRSPPSTLWRSRFQI